MFTRLYHIYRYESRYVATFVTEDYLRKFYTMHEAVSAMLMADSSEIFRSFTLYRGLVLQRALRFGSHDSGIAP